MHKKLLSLIAVACILVMASCKKEDSKESTHLTVTLVLDSSCPGTDSVQIELYETGHSTILLTRYGKAGSSIDFGDVNPGYYNFRGIDIQQGSSCNYWSSVSGKNYYSDNFQIVAGEGKHVELH